MMKLEDIPQAGIMILSVYFEGYGGSYANDSRRKLKERIPVLGKREDIDIEIIPIQFSLIKTVADGVSRAIGAQYQYGFSKMTPEKFRKLSEEIGKLKFKWWEDHEIIIGDSIEGF